MSDRVDVQLGAAPWRPSPDSEVVATYRYYDGPLTGVVAQHGNEYVFMCLDGELETLSLWFYAPIRLDQRERLEALDGDAFAEALAHEEFSGCVTLAFATERLGIVDFESVEDCENKAMHADRMSAALMKLRRRLSDLSEDAGHLELTLA